jgi:hypothetical protein
LTQLEALMSRYITILSLGIFLSTILIAAVNAGPSP